MSNPSPKDTGEFGPYQTLETLGQGGTAVVYKARHRLTGAIVALKVVPEMSMTDPTSEKRFHREFELAHNVCHPHLIRAIEFGEAGDYLYQALEFVTGKTLEERVRETGPLPLDEAVTAFLQVAAALQCLHENGIVHRDVKPSNIMLDDAGSAKLFDFGLLKNVAVDSTALTRSRQSLGTLGYGAPEQFEDAKRADQRCDIYSLAATFYTALTGKLPFGSGGNLKILRRKLLNQFVPLTELAREIAPELNAFITRALHFDPAQRPSRCDEFIACLDDQRLKLEQAKQTRTSPAEGKAQANDKNRRRAERLPVHLAATCERMFEQGRANWTAAIVDLSVNGLCLRASCSFPIDTILQVQLQGADNPAHAWHLVRVRWVKPSARETWNIGCVLIHPLSPERFSAMQETGAPKNVAFQSGEAEAEAAAS